MTLTIPTGATHKSISFSIFILLTFSDVDTGNPLVSELQEDIEPDDASNVIKPKTKLLQRRPVSDGSSEVDEKSADMKQTNDEFDSTLNSEISELTSEAFDTWMGADTKWRRSPEGTSFFLQNRKFYFYI